MSTSEHVEKPYQCLVLAAILQAKKDLRGADFLKALDALMWLIFGDGEALAEMVGAKIDFLIVFDWLLED